MGNDDVHIIWNEHKRPYKRKTISGDYGNVQIVINPLLGGLYAIDLLLHPKVQSVLHNLDHPCVSTHPLSAPVVAAAKVWAAV